MFLIQDDNGGKRKSNSDSSDLSFNILLSSKFLMRCHGFCIGDNVGLQVQYACKYHCWVIYKQCSFAVAAEE